MTQKIADIKPETLAGLPIEKLIEYYSFGQIQMEEIQAAMAAVKDEVVMRLDAEGVKGKVVGDHTVTKATRVVFRTTLEEAKELGAVKEAVDTVALKRLYDSGAPVPNTSITTYLLVKALEQKGDEKK
jgi:hypothetical protein